GNKGFLITILFFVSAAICGVISHVSPAPAEVADVARYQIEIEATAAAATPDVVGIVNANRTGLAETQGESSGRGWVLFTLSLMLIIILALGAVLLFVSTGFLKQGRLALKTVGVG